MLVNATSAAQLRPWLTQWPGPDSLVQVLARLGDPHLAYPVVHVAGTNGKGSVTAMIAGMLRAAGKRVGRFTSPKLETPADQLWIDGRSCPPAELEVLLAEARAAARQVEQAGLTPAPFSDFDMIACAALAWFAHEQVDVAVLEVGLGGRLDSTNVVAAPVLTIITNISLDHTEILGPDAAAIAREKAGILKPGRPVLTQAEGDALAVIQEIARDKGAPLTWVPAAEPSAAPPGAPGRKPRGQGIRFAGREWELGLRGTYQQKNAALALEAAFALRDQGWVLGEDALRQGLASATWPGRMEFLEIGESRWLLDGAHNEAGMRELVRSLDELPELGHPVAVFGALADKPAAAMLELLAPQASALILTTPPSDRAMPAADLAAFSPLADTRIVADPSAALELAREIAGSGTILVCGSLFLVGMARSRLLAHNGAAADQAQPS